MVVSFKVVKRFKKMAIFVAQLLLEYQA